MGQDSGLGHRCCGSGFQVYLNDWKTPIRSTNSFLGFANLGLPSEVWALVCLSQNDDAAPLCFQPNRLMGSTWLLKNRSSIWPYCDRWKHE